MINNSKVRTARYLVVVVTVAVAIVVVVVVVIKSVYYPSMDGMCHWWGKLATRYIEGAMGVPFHP